MKNPQTVTAFQIGSSTAVTLPKRFGVLPGQKFKVTQKNDQISLKMDRESRVEAIKLVDSLSGGLKLKKHLNPDELNKLFEQSYEE